MAWRFPRMRQWRPPATVESLPRPRRGAARDGTAAVHRQACEPTAIAQRRLETRAEVPAQTRPR
ncbi:hypothetical protein ACQW02_25690 [Humitalea sp. 24SJ18S-53]|uniref:hypothetical protein n=1 Tax=Humitalea sp. 24SJ18S-53 TaxID=3422307 RepID=UPI003D668E47